MSVVITNEITVDPARADEVIAKFAENSRAIVQRSGFLGFELCRPTNPDDNRWLVVTRWRDEDAYEQWRDSKGFARSHKEESGNHHSGGPSESAARSVVRHYDVAFSTAD